ncbi:MAG: hypothetical protein A2268_06720 [Candidatus Raymondbacteria bacterium RifOxyA12_full_50_37]|uniref:Polymerase/histidinol phosphatase N-terminal domain-containing protein n=1 Tax=Candidatus Raymondbacteria bacterium RIFOXYD12_FULL_49_13 TaxID=1817890 RepID=A0A1F7F035_UNCRA|nr:MAG: hypothetical protein A2350_00615 [Candidatus Raymondbacteria bacterium RifOxyB12_full_50_8]OGJ87216.1 MAG: hypothetical protein A2268_06720 [Candidatus Raymondbacteria bacterium RifOxyA12_full_50_37]OGJ88787.1 MAG: hypothetical protein A2248_08300 [Candidatus Raymondbacteria bacterium RIFOXYA2_FULL_49_16]OGJ96546.1 MAG: hypothetical protein A2453_03265 [Candidatus Raymondbacteria bacterium RIFOXYC2_FULL_50_21]OGJ99165.1 MAG: hypothetical protein A2487_10330 [Candidatus Raymondbacteria b
MMWRLFPLYRRSYVETHFRFRFGFSLLFRKAPEILFDVPFRINPAQEIPVAMLIKDADRYPVELRHITATISLAEKNRTFLHNLFPSHTDIRTPLWHQVFTLPLPKNYSGKIHLNFKVEYTIHGKPSFFMNDNLPFGSHIGYTVLVSRTKLPTLPGFASGDMHMHSRYTNDEVEYGAPLAVVPPLARAQGLSFACVLDHSYDLDGRNPFNNSTETFAAMRDEAISRSDSSFVLLPGEEVSARNRKNKTVHAGVVNHGTFFPGYRDSGRNFCGKNQDSTVELLSQQAGTNPNALVFAAHPRPGWLFLEKTLLNRGNWEQEDITDNIAAIQFWNGTIDAAFFKGKKMWLSLLSAGKKVVIIGGNDAHGDFNRTRRIGFPFLFIREDNKNRFGFVRTVVACNQLSRESIVDAVKAGRAMVTNGPFVSIQIDAGVQHAAMGGIVTGKDIRMTVHALSTEEFGALCSLTLFHGEIGHGEKMIFSGKPQGLSENLAQEMAIERPGWIRAEVSSRLGKDVFFGMTNPIWINP